MKKHHTKRQAIKEVGLALILTFIPIGMYVKVFVGNMIIGNLLMLIGFLFIFPYKNIFCNKKKIKWPSNIKWFVSFFILSLFYLFFYSTTDVSIKNEILYLGVSLGVCFALVNTKYEYDLKIDNVILYTLILSFICVLFGLFFCMSGMRDNFVYYVQDKLIYDDLTAGSISVLNICCCLYLLYGSNKRTFFKCLFILFIFIDLYHMILTTKRTPLIIGILSLLYAMYINRNNQRNGSIKRIYIYVSIFVVIICIFTNEMLYQSIVNIFNSIFKGVNDLVFGASFDEANSTSIRYNARQSAIDDIMNFSLMELFFGKGYMYRWIDIPLMQAYMDMGILGFLLFARNIIVVPLICMKRYAVNNRRIMWATLICFYGLFGALTTGTPYGHGKWLFLAVLLFVLNGEKTYRTMKKTEVRTDEKNILQM